MSSRQERREHIKHHASKKLRVNLGILSFVYVVLLFITFYQLLKSDAIFWQVAIAIVIGFAAGLISARMYKISWSADDSKVIGRIDMYGAIVLVLFILFELNRTKVAELFASGESIGAISLVLVTAALFGRIVGTGKKILRVIRDDKPAPAK